MDSAVSQAPLAVCRGIRMKAAIIGASKEALHTIEKAHQYGMEVIALDGNPDAAGLRAADKPMTVDISDEAAVIAALEQEKPDFVLTVPIGRYLTAIGAANDALKLPGISREMAVLCTDKFSFHKRLSGKGLRKCRCYAISGKRITDENGKVFSWGNIGRDMEAIAISFPAILKPRYGSGSRGIQMLYDKAQLEAALAGIAEKAHISDEAYVLEECAQGEEYGVDGAVTKDGFWMVLLRRKKNTPPPARQAVGYFSVPPEDLFYKSVCGYMKKAVECLGLKECLLHADIVKTANGPFAIEISARPSGHHLHDFFTPLCTGVDMAEEYIKYRMGNSYDFAPRGTRSMMIHYFDMQGKVRKVPEREQAERMAGMRFTAWECKIKEGEDLAPISDGHSIMGRGYFVLEGEEQLLLEDRAEIVTGLFL